MTESPSKRPVVANAPTKAASGDEEGFPQVYPPATLPDVGQDAKPAVLCLKDGTVYQGYSFGAEKSICGECVFQTGKRNTINPTII
jgi:hypothetical protein